MLHATVWPYYRILTIHSSTIVLKEWRKRHSEPSQGTVPCRAGVGFFCRPSLKDSFEMTRHCPTESSIETRGGGLVPALNLSVCVNYGAY